MSNFVSGYEVNHIQNCILGPEGNEIEITHMKDVSL